MDQQPATHNPTPLLSVIIPHYNAVQHLPTCFRALRAQSYPHLEVILVDNGSGDESVAMTRRDFPEVKIIQLGQNLGLTGAINRGMAQAGGEIIVPLNNDTEVAPDWAKALVEALNKAKPASAKGVYLKKVAVSSTLGIGVRVDQASLAQ